MAISTTLRERLWKQLRSWLAARQPAAGSRTCLLPQRAAEPCFALQSLARTRRWPGSLPTAYLVLQTASGVLQESHSVGLTPGLEARHALQHFDESWPEFTFLQLFGYQLLGNLTVLLLPCILPPIFTLIYEMKESFAHLSNVDNVIFAQTTRINSVQNSRGLPGHGKL